ncbi:hypothetical protein PAHAL_8G113400 [Panicum hallii]|jgi:hypothetical protein|uniref:Rx N-terminal domain-containing protein n=1 Tax=Panicum hallii TaxID=206008 RepID=A0A2S3IDG4_9POAL|nr:uncharacterized protein LOC112903333 [Panicum hallii]XP_025828356.1 uncharacterized protein LOC112903333 [Panicum hallii]XP_025828357.1 uncharacterized protein LOC112903333 [Panicum hallii]XP_025828358.1 uncharacterized protein LOC112903333 [Panicum hallii]XP_025828360.1 uncharacterized protein LOC112903333 [Panicum hallii]XP_025828361.1 uncharacterized protein LOC112903333 [Panicum hallii]PAN41960.1 hypothetical protein PAHAL_8G113400 [Panicum hallii]
MAAEIASCAIVGEVVGRIFSGIIDHNKDRSDEGDNSSLERLEMACIKLDATIETSEKWQITDVALLRWRKKLKRVALECDDSLRRCKQRSLEDKETREKLRQSYPRRVAHTTKSFISSVVGHKNEGEPISKAAVQRFERLAHGADEFLRFVELSGTPRRYMFFDPLVQHLFAGKYVQYQMLQQHQGSMRNCFSIRPMSFEERGLEAMLAFIHEDGEAPKKNFRLGLMLRLSESTDVIGITVKCLQLLMPHFNSITEVVIGELTQLPTQDFNWLPMYDEPGNMEHWKHHDTLTRWFRPDPLCCKQYELQDMAAACSRSSSTSSLRLSSIFPEQVIGVFLQRNILPSEYGKLQASKMMTCYSTSSSQGDVSPLKLGVLFKPHHPSEDIKFAPEAESSAIEAIDGGKQQLLHVNVHPNELDKLLLPKAVDYLHHNAESAIYQISWKSAHGSVHLCVEEPSKEMTGTSRPVTLQDWKNKRNGFMALKGERGTTEVVESGMVAQRVVSLLLTLALVRATLTAG